MANKLVKSFLIAFFCILIPFSANALLQYLIINEQGDLQLTVFTTESSNLLQSWIRTPPSYALYINTITETQFNHNVTTGFAVTGFTKGPDSKVNLVIDVQIFSPDGSILLRGENWASYTKEVSIDKGIIFIEPFIDIGVESTDPAGNHKILATVTDKISNKKATSSVILKIMPDNILPLQKKDDRPDIVDKSDETEPKVILSQNLETTKIVEYARISVGANIRSDASLTSEILHTVPPGYPVAVLARQADWLLVEDYQRRKGWVFESLVKKPKTIIIKVDKGNLRRGPSFKEDVMAQLDHGKIMPVLERTGEWLKVSDFEGLTGWLHREDIWPEVQMNVK